MVLPLIVSAVSLAIGAAGVLLADCTTPAFDLFPGDPLQLCAGAASIGVSPEPWMGIGIAVVGLLGLVAAWAPNKRRRERKADRAAISTLERNLERIKSAPTLEPLSDPGSSEDQQEPAESAYTEPAEV